MSISLSDHTYNIGKFWVKHTLVFSVLFLKFLWEGKIIYKSEKLKSRETTDININMENFLNCQNKSDIHMHTQVHTV